MTCDGPGISKAENAFIVIFLKLFDVFALCFELGNGIGFELYIRFLLFGMGGGTSEVGVMMASCAA